MERDQIPEAGFPAHRAMCLLEVPPPPCLVCVFGASGDLAARKLLPSLYELYFHRDVPDDFGIVGAARTEYSDDQFRAKMRQAVEDKGLDLSRWDEFAQRLFYQPVVYDDDATYKELGRRLDQVAEDLGLGPNRIFNLTIPPTLYATVARHLAAAGLATSPGGWVRLVVEKPFGWDLESSRELNQAIAEGFSEDQVFRIDHYLAKNTVQNIMMFRFANAIFEPIWKRSYIDFVSIIASESIGVEHRAGYYDAAGVLRDMFQNHMLQLMALVAAEPPSLFEADRVRDEKTKLFRSLRPFPLDNLYDHLCLGQYTEGQIDGEAVPAYRDEPGVDDNSLTPTYATMRLFVDNWRWQGVPFHLTSGKRLREKITRIDIYFKEVPTSLFRKQLGDSIQANRLVLSIHPHEAITLSIQTKQSGHRFCLRGVGLNFDFALDGGQRQIDAYEKVLLDAMLGDHTLFWRQDGVELCWAFLDPILKECETCRERDGKLKRYPAGSWGPREAFDILPPVYRSRGADREGGQ